LAEEDDPYFREIAHFARCVQTGEAPLVTPEEARAAVAIAAAARESIRTGAAVAVEEETA
jgi:myo-inositol 2-dehydrogenase/D-chiro-inositol 1-dehydrogenase